MSVPEKLHNSNNFWFINEMTLHTCSHLERAIKHMQTKIISGDALYMKHMPQIYTFGLYFGETRQPM